MCIRGGNLLAYIRHRLSSRLCFHVVWEAGRDIMSSCYQIRRVFLNEPGKYQRLVDKLNYLTVTRHDIAFVVSIVSQFRLTSKTTRWDTIVQILKYLKKAPGKRLLYSDYGHTKVVGFSYADWADWTRSSIDKRSTIRFYIFLEKNLS